MDSATSGHLDSASNSMSGVKSVSSQKIVDCDSDMESDEDIVNSGIGVGSEAVWVTACGVCKLCGHELELKEDVDVVFNGWTLLYFCLLL